MRGPLSAAPLTQDAKQVLNQTNTTSSSVSCFLEEAFSLRNLDRLKSSGLLLLPVLGISVVLLPLTWRRILGDREGEEA